jgi:phage tail sheath protein FI
MPEYLAPGVYVEEVESGPKPIEGVSTSTAGMVGMTVRGPVAVPLPAPDIAVAPLPQLVTSFAEFRRRYGGYLPESFDDNRFLAHAVRGFFENGGKRVYIQRVLGENSGIATATPAAGVITRLTQDLVLDSAGNGATSATLSTLRGIFVGTDLTLTMVKDGLLTTETVTVTNYIPAQNRVEWAAPLTRAYEFRRTSVSVDVAGGPFTTPLVISAADPGEWGNRISVQIFHTSRAQAQVISLSADPSDATKFDIVLLTSTSNFYVGAIVEFDRGPDAGAPPDKVYARVREIVGNSILIDVPFAADTALDPQALAATTIARSCEFRVVASYEGANESFGPLTLDETTPFYFVNVINNQSNLIRVTQTVPGPIVDNDPFRQPSGTDGLNVILTGGADGDPALPEKYRGDDSGPGTRTGLEALKDIDEISIIAIPGITDQSVQNAMITQCETLLDRFAVFDPVYTSNAAMDDIRAQRKLYDTKYAALYFPKLIAIDPVTGLKIVLPPSGHMIGLYAKTDVERGVHKAPANVVVQGIIDLDKIINKGEQDILNPDNINVIRDFRVSNRGIRVWGARCLTSDTQWKYVPVRRLFIFVEESLDEGTQWVVFEPNDYPLWARVRQSISNFLIRVWRDGALMGATQEEAFFVRCDRTTMTQDDIDNGRLIILVGIAPVKPAEFVIIRISQYTAEANVA